MKILHNLKDANMLETHDLALMQEKFVLLQLQHRLLTN